MILSSPAKINLFLRVIGRRGDGFHELASLFQTVTLCDTLTFRLALHDRLTCDDSAIPVDDSNLIFKAAELFRRKTGLQFGLQVDLEKRIPHQAGLGGGSSNAATTLWALNKLHDCLATTAELQNWAAEIGSDVAFFLSEGTSYCTGRGEVMEPQPYPGDQPVTIVKPFFGLATAEVYRMLRVDQLVDRDLQEALRSWQEGSYCFFNDLEDAAFTIRPELKSFRKYGFTLCGSGSALFMLGKSTDAPDGCQVYPAHFINRRPGHWYELTTHNLQLTT